jgi:hypothetical protein
MLLFPFILLYYTLAYTPLPQSTSLLLNLKLIPFKILYLSLSLSLPLQLRSFAYLHIIKVKKKVYYSKCKNPLRFPLFIYNIYLLLSLKAL